MDGLQHHRRSVRLAGFDYAAPGGYFVTAVAQDRACIFGRIEGGEMRLSVRGRIAEECWRSIPEHFSAVELGAYVVMPNHVHGIIVLHPTEEDGPNISSQDVLSRDVGEHGLGTIVPNRRGTPWRAPTLPERFGKPVRGSLASIMRQYKSTVTRRIVQQFGGQPRVWQRNYYEHVIRDDADWKRIHRYIESNAVNWAQDEENR